MPPLARTKMIGVKVARTAGSANNTAQRNRICDYVNVEGKTMFYMRSGIIAIIKYYNDPKLD